MRQIIFPDTGQKRLTWYLAAEEFVAANLVSLTSDSPSGEHEAFFMWQVAPTVIFGRNQIMEAEVNLPFCKEHRINLVRRKSGGGCVYADMGNIMISYICDRTDVAFVFARFMDRLELALRRLGVQAVRSGRNDIMIGGRKVSGTAFSLLPNASIVHSTLLFDVDLDMLEKAITPSEDKLAGRGIKSVRSHVTNLKAELEAAGHPLTIDAVKEQLSSCFCNEISPRASLGRNDSHTYASLGRNDSNSRLTIHPQTHATLGTVRGGTKALANGGVEQSETVLGWMHQPASQIVEAINAIEQSYLRPEFLYGRHSSDLKEYRKRIEGAGEVIVSIGLEEEKIKTVDIKGDYFGTGVEGSTTLQNLLQGLPLQETAIDKALSGKDLGIMGLTPEQFKDLIFSKEEITT